MSDKDPPKINKLSPESKPKRSSLKQRDKLDIKDIIEYNKNKKRHSVSWNVSIRKFNLEGVKTNFESNTEKKDKEKNEEFLEKRRRSIKNEFVLAKELIKKENVIEEIKGENYDEIKENTFRNVEVGKEGIDIK
jgi:hypothetical protein